MLKIIFEKDVLITTGLWKRIQEHCTFAELVKLRCIQIVE